MPIAFIIVRNGNYEALSEFGKRFDMPDLPGMELPGLDFCELARGHGVRATRVARVEELDEALRGAFQSTTPVLVEVSASPSW